MRHYIEHKEAGRATLAKSGNQVVLTEARFKASDGTADDPVTRSLTMDKIDEGLTRAELNAEEALSYVEDMKQFKLDAQALLSED